MTGTVIQHGGALARVHVSPGESTDGHVVTVRHDIAHVLVVGAPRGARLRTARRAVGGCWRRQEATDERRRTGLTGGPRRVRVFG